jgi:RNA polymerase sigma factor (sigma-70 family)
VSSPAQRGDEAELFERHANHLVRMVQARTGAPHDVAEDACTFAWMQLLRNQPERESIVGWLFVVAANEARRLLRAPRPAELDEDSDRDVSAYRSRTVDVEVTVEAYEALEGIADLSEQQVRIFSLHLAGLTYTEICAATGYSRRQVDRHIVRARARLRERHSDQRHAARLHGADGGSSR